jgi:uncharacterized membrane protein HdeD (DUF308 family)
MSSSQSRKRGLVTLAFAVVYIIVGVLLIYWNFTSAISSVTFGIGIFILIVASLIFKVVTDFIIRKKH